MIRAAAWLAALALSVPGAAVAGNWSYGGETSAGYDSNAGNSGHPGDRQGSGFLSASTQATWEQRFGGYTALQVRQGLAFEQWTRLGQLSNTRYSVRARLLHRPGREFHTPVLAAWAGAGARHSASDIRSGVDTRAGFSVTLPLTTAVQARAEAAHAWRKAARGGAFDLDNASYALDFDWRASSALVAYGGVRVTDGDITVTARGFGVVEPKDQHLYLEPRADAIDADPAFGDDWWAFRVSGRTVAGTLGVNLPLSPTLALDLQLQRAQARMGGFSYVRGVGVLGVLVRW